jgi:hypothetical protein
MRECNREGVLEVGSDRERVRGGGGSGVTEKE